MARWVSQVARQIRTLKWAPVIERHSLLGHENTHTHTHGESAEPTRSKKSTAGISFQLQAKMCVYVVVCVAVYVSVYARACLLTFPAVSNKLNSGFGCRPHLLSSTSPPTLLHSLNSATLLRLMFFFFFYLKINFTQIKNKTLSPLSSGDF